MNEPLNLVLFIWQGQTFNDQLTWKDSAGAPVDLTGYTVQMMARKDIADAVPQFTWSDATGEIVLGGAAGTITFNVSSAATFALQSSLETVQWVYDMLFTAPSGLADRLIQGSIVIRPGVTRP
jgi:hypothetical protein